MRNRLYVANLSYTVTRADLVRLFAVYGALSDARLTAYPSGQPTGSATVNMESEDAGDAAVAALDGREYRGRPLVVGRAAEPPTAGYGESEAPLPEGGLVLAVDFGSRVGRCGDA